MSQAVRRSTITVLTAREWSERSQAERKRLLRAVLPQRVNDTTSSPSDVSEGNSDDSGVNPLAIIAGVAALAGVGGAAYYFTRKRK